MAIKKTAREEKAENNRQLIIQTAVALFGDYGFERVTVDDICQHAGISKSTFYSHFHTKHDLAILYAAVDRNRFLEKRYVYDENKPLKTLFHEFFCMNFEYNRRDSRDWNRSSYVSYIHTHRQKRQENHFYQQELRRLVERGLRENAFRANLSFDEHYRMIHDWIIGFLIGWSVYPDDTPGVDEMYEHILANMVDVLLK